MGARAFAQLPRPGGFSLTRHRPHRRKTRRQETKTDDCSLLTLLTIPRSVSPWLRHSFRKLMVKSDGLCLDKRPQLMGGTEPCVLLGSSSERSAEQELGPGSSRNRRPLKGTLACSLNCGFGERNARCVFLVITFPTFPDLSCVQTRLPVQSGSSRSGPGPGRLKSSPTVRTVQIQLSGAQPIPRHPGSQLSHCTRPRPPATWAVWPASCVCTPPTPFPQVPGRHLQGLPLRAPAGSAGPLPATLPVVDLDTAAGIRKETTGRQA